jgi:hypothetical protein
MSVISMATFFIRRNKTVPYHHTLLSVPKICSILALRFILISSWVFIRFLSRSITASSSQRLMDLPRLEVEHRASAEQRRQLSVRYTSTMRPPFFQVWFYCSSKYCLVDNGMYQMMHHTQTSCGGVSFCQASVRLPDGKARLASSGFRLSPE